MTDSTITGITILNSPVQVFSIDSSTSLNMIDITIDDTEGTTDGLGAVRKADLGFHSS
jgi:polygalacturonase